MRSIAEFALAVGVLTIIPGPDTLLAVRTAVAQGRSQAIAAAVGSCTALAGWGCAAGLGLTALLAASPALHAVLRWAGVAYLAYLGLRSLVAGSRAPAATSLGSQAAEEGPRPAADAHSGPADRASNVGRASAGSQFRCLRGSYLRGALTNASNPKVGVFYLSLFPQFIPAGASPLSFSLMLTSIHAAESLIWLVAVAGLASKLARLLRRTSPRRWADRISGAAFLAFAARLAAGG
jgi:threonine/homoserine/homoserine lactone efflux protein